jgi:Calx-beta domain-containing protein
MGVNRLFSNGATYLFGARLLGLMCLLFVAAQTGFAQATPSLSINDITANEGDSGLFGREFVVSLSAASSQTVSVKISTQADTASDNADFGAGSVTINIQPGQTSQTVTVFINGDTIVEGTEQFFLNLSNPVNATIADGQGVGTIIDDDSLILLSQPSSQRAPALNSALLTQETFPIVSNLNFFSVDNRTRIAVFAIGLKLANGETASAVTATAEDSVGTVRPLTVEFVGKIPNINDWITEVVLKLNDQITLTGDVKIKISLHGQTSNTVLVAVKPQ